MYSVLLIEDEEMIRKGIKYSVPWDECNCYVVGEAGNGQEGMECIKALSPDIVITDINMPVLDGLEMIAKTREEYTYIAILLTGYSEFDYAREALKMGVTDYLLKPIDMQEMKDSLSEAIHRLKDMEVLRQQSGSIEEWKTFRILPEGDMREQTDPIVEKIRSYICENYQHKVTFTEIEALMHYSERHINKKFQQELGTTVMEYLTRFRLQKALGMIKNGEEISNIGWKCGIGDYKYFHRVFKKYMGCSPREYRAKVL